MIGANETKVSILNDFSRRITHLEECGSTKVNELEITVIAHDKCIEKLDNKYDKGVLTVIILSFISGANAIMNLIEFVRSFIH